MSDKTNAVLCPLIIRAHRLMDAFAKSDDERDFYLDRMEGFLVCVDLAQTEAELSQLEQELEKNTDRYAMLPKYTFYESKKIMEGFVNEKVYDIDIKEKSLDIIQSKSAREHFLEFLHDHHTELEKWQLYYQERSRVRIIEWLRSEAFQFVFEEDIDLPGPTVEKLKKTLFDAKPPRDMVAARKAIQAKAESYYSNEALNPRPKRGRPPKQAAKVELEPTVTGDFYQKVPKAIQPFLYVPNIASVSSVTFSAKFDTEQELIEYIRSTKANRGDEVDEIQKKLAALREITLRAQRKQT